MKKYHPIPLKLENWLVLLIGVGHSIGLKRVKYRLNCVSDELHEKEILERNSKDIIFKTFPEFLNKTIHDGWSLQSILVLVQNNQLGHTHGHEHLLDEMAKAAWPVENDTYPFTPHTHHHDDGHAHDHSHDFLSHSRVRRGAGPNHKHDLLTDAAMHRHYLLHELTHAFHLGSMVILTLLVLVTYFKMFVMGKKFLHHKIEVWFFVLLYYYG